MPLKDPPGEPETGRLILQRAGVSNATPRVRPKRRRARAVDGPEAVSSGLIERFVIATAGEPPRMLLDQGREAWARRTAAKDTVKTVRRSTMTMREALRAAGLPGSTPYDRGLHVEADDSVCVVHLRRAL